MYASPAPAAWPRIQLGLDQMTDLELLTSLQLQSIPGSTSVQQSIWFRMASIAFGIGLMTVCYSSSSIVHQHVANGYCFFAQEHGIPWVVSLVAPCIPVSW